MRREHVSQQQVCIRTDLYFNPSGSTRKVLPQAHDGARVDIDVSWCPCASRGCRLYEKLSIKVSLQHLSVPGRCTVHECARAYQCKGIPA